MPLVEFSGQSVQDQGNKAINTARLINCYRELVMDMGKTQHVIQSVLGQDLLSDVGAGALRAFGRANGSNWAAGNGKLFQMAGDGTLTERGTIADDAVTAVEGNYSDVTITAGNNYYVWDGSTLTQPTTKAFTNVGHHFYFGGYTVLLEKNGKRFQWSALGDAGTLTASHVASAEKVDDNLVRGFEVQGVAVLMCERSSEMWQLSGQAGINAFAFVTSWNRGLKSANLAVKFDDSLFFVGDDNNVYLGVGPGATDITTPAINTSLEQNTATHCFYYEDRGHKFCVLRFSDRPAWVYDVKMGEWHERAESLESPWRAVASIEGDTWQVGNGLGEIYSLSRTNLDLSAPLTRRMISSPVYLGGKFRVVKFEANIRVGEVMLNDATTFVWSLGGGRFWQLDTDIGWTLYSTTGEERAGQVSLFVSRDGGRTFGAAKIRSLGLSGEYDKRTVWRALGQAQQFCVELRIDDPADFQVNSTAILEVA